MLHGRRQTAVAVAGAAALVLFGLRAYGFALRLPFFSDDMALLRFAQAHDFLRTWGSAWRLGSYRPLQLLTWQALALVQGRYAPTALHALNLGLHLLNAILVLLLVAGRRREGSLAYGLGAAVLFLLFPFSYQAVPWVGALNHLQVTVLILGSLLLYRASATSFPVGAQLRRLLRAASIALAILAPLANETGVLIAPLLLLLLLADDKPLPLARALRCTLPYWLCAAAGLAIWLAVPKEGSRGQLLDPATWWHNGVYLVQGLIYPVAPLAGRLARAGRGLDALQATALVATLTTAAWCGLLWRAGRGRALALALGWFALAAAPACLMLDAEYVASGARLLYEAAVGAALFWALPLDLSWRGGRLQVARTALAVLFVAAVAMHGYRFVQARVPLYEQMRLAVEQLLASRPAAERDPILCVNYPLWFAPPHNTFPVGHEGVVLAPGYSSVGELLWVHTGEERPVESVVLFDLLPKGPWTYIFPCIGRPVGSDELQPELRQARRVIVTSYAARDIAVYDAGGLEAENRPRAQSYVAAFAERIGLVAARCERQGRALRIEFRWQCWAPVAQETTVFVHLYDEAGKLIAQADGYPVMGTSRLVAWRPGDEWRDVRLMPLPADVVPGQYTLEAGLYPVAGGPRLSAVGPASERFPDEAVPIATLTLP